MLITEQQKTYRDWEVAADEKTIKSNHNLCRSRRGNSDRSYDGSGGQCLKKGIGRNGAG